MIRTEEHIPSYFAVPGRPLSDRTAIARAFVAKAIYDMGTTRILEDNCHIRFCDMTFHQFEGGGEVALH